MSIGSAAVASAALLLSFAIVCTIHVTLAFSLAKQRPRLLALVALVVPFAAPVLAYRARMRWRAAIYVVCVLVYALARGVGPA